ncbi:hypothetical protein K491DRAFT_480093 [Lophiostoma macrostomum CBS 122681]|uniref:Uncharacterized protein n=1 Tax=Lophiostoma macrostomum CBS 122681 TaxID=1314788 RepID=A0A6A6TQD3_9PLEO|nr:hypothetical protein K491DRAFT_480093 [Lophiostoma macrostomum CBS 122681]
MGRTAPAAGSYRDDPDAVSLHTTPDDYNYDDAPEITGLPPSYADVEDENAAAAPVIQHLPPPEFQFKRMNHDNLWMSHGKPQVYSTQNLIDSRYDSDPQHLERDVRKLAQQAPNPLIYIMGTHKETTKRGDKKETKEVTDFRIVISMKEALCHVCDQGGCHRTPPMRLTTASNGEKTYRGSFIKKRAPGFKQDIEVGTSVPDLREWCHRYCASPSLLRTFRLRREVRGFNEEFLKNRIEGLIRSTNYRGHLSITFPIEDQSIDIYTSNFINNWRLKTWVRWIFYLTFLWIFTWPYLLFATKRYAIVKTEWFYSSVDDSGNKKYSTISEEDWFQRWHVGVRRLALDRFQGEASYEELRGVQARPADPPMPGTINTGHVGVDNAVGLLQQGFQVASAISRGSNLARGLQGGWGYDC